VLKFLTAFLNAAQVASFTSEGTFPVEKKASLKASTFSI